MSHKIKKLIAGEKVFVRRPVQQADLAYELLDIEVDVKSVVQDALLRHEVTDRATVVQDLIFALDKHEGMAPVGHPADNAWQRLCAAISEFVQAAGRYEDEI